MTRKKHKIIVADETDPSQQAAADHYGKSSGKIPGQARDALGQKD